jgi:glutamine amidotransferase PdxT
MFTENEPGKPSERVLATIADPNGSSTQIIAAVEQGPLLATIFHPELTEDVSFHQYFVEIVKKHKSSFTASQ